jgi:hypothetical protein
MQAKTATPDKHTGTRNVLQCLQLVHVNKGCTDGRPTRVLNVVASKAART